ncbi:MAG: DUF2284 domain-containing protein [Methanobrevibacter sp.]|nr:DUF2284 domain-containing protein [Methanobrevibacter sp.]
MISLDELSKEITESTNDYENFEFKFIDTVSIVVEPWTRLKCQYGCPNYGKTLVCPPFTPKAEEFEEMLNSYKTAILFQISLADMGDDLGMITKIAVDIENLCARLGFYKAFGMGAGTCLVCKSKGEECDLNECKYPNEARPSGEACGVDVHKTIENNGYDLLGIDEENDSYFCYGLVLLD